MESYNDFMKRIGSFEKPSLSINTQDFSPSQSVFQKVDENNFFSHFYGDTIVFDLNSEEKERILGIIHTLYAEAPECFCERLDDKTLHMTLHDLSNSPIKENVLAEVTSNKAKLVEILKKHPLTVQTIKMKTNYIINMVNTSLVLALCPVNEKEYEKLMALYHLMDGVKSLPYPFTPHITLAYYSRNAFKQTSAHKLMECVSNLNKGEFEVILNTKRLVYQRFESMNHYENTFYLTS